MNIFFHKYSLISYSYMVIKENIKYLKNSKKRKSIIQWIINLLIWKEMWILFHNFENHTIGNFWPEHLSWILDCNSLWRLKSFIQFCIILENEGKSVYLVSSISFPFMNKVEKCRILCNKTIVFNVPKLMFFWKKCVYEAQLSQRGLAYIDSWCPLFLLVV